MGYVDDSTQAKRGDIVLFKGSGLVYEILSRALKFFEWNWDRWGWHLGFVSGDSPFTDVVSICESTGKGVTESYLDLTRKDIRVYRWFDEEPRRYKVRNFVSAHLGCDYDVAQYFWTGLQYLIRHFWNRRIPRLLDSRYTCWELVFEFAEDMGKPIGSRYDCPMLVDLLKVVDC